MEVKQLKCPSCGATLEFNSSTQLFIECSYCHQHFFNEHINSYANVNKLPLILPFKHDKNEILKIFVEALVEAEEAAYDIFKKISIVSIKKYYVPSYIYEGTLTASWTSSQIFHDQKQRIGKDGNIEYYTEDRTEHYSGQSVDNFSAHIFPNSIMKNFSLDHYCLWDMVINYHEMSIISDVKVENDIECLPIDEDSKAIWMEHGRSWVRKAAENVSKYQAPGHLNNVTEMYELKDTMLVYLPLWEIIYAYENENFKFVFYGNQLQNLEYPSKILKNSSSEIYDQMIKAEEYAKYNKTKWLWTRILGCITIITISFYLHDKSTKMLKDLYTHDNWNEIKNQAQSLDGWAAFIFWVILPLFCVVSWFMARRGEERVDNLSSAYYSEINDAEQRAHQMRKDSSNNYLKSLIYNYGKQSNSDRVCSNEYVESPQINDLFLVQQDDIHRTNKHCVNCGRVISIEHKFCKYCGMLQEC